MNEDYSGEPDGIGGQISLSPFPGAYNNQGQDNQNDNFNISPDNLNIPPDSQYVDQKNDQHGTIGNSNNRQRENQKEEHKEKENDITSAIKNSSNPKVAFTTILLKILALASFILLSLFTSNEAIVMLVVILLTAADFWYTKNISGRILVGLKWYTYIDSATGYEKYGSYIKNEKKTGSDPKIFWISLYASTGGWVFFFVWELIRLKFMWASISFIAAFINFTNTYGYMRCSKEQEKVIKNLITNVAKNNRSK